MMLTTSQLSSTFHKIMLTTSQRTKRGCYTRSMTLHACCIEPHLVLLAGGGELARVALGGVGEGSGVGGGGGGERLLGVAAQVEIDRKP